MVKRNILDDTSSSSSDSDSDNDSDDECFDSSRHPSSPRKAHHPRSSPSKTPQSVRSFSSTSSSSSTLQLRKANVKGDATTGRRRCTAVPQSTVVEGNANQNRRKHLRVATKKRKLLNKITSLDSSSSSSDDEDFLFRGRTALKAALPKLSAATRNRQELQTNSSTSARPNAKRSSPHHSDQDDTGNQSDDTAELLRQLQKTKRKFQSTPSPSHHSPLSTTPATTSRMATDQKLPPGTSTLSSPLATKDHTKGLEGVDDMDVDDESSIDTVELSKMCPIRQDVQEPSFQVVRTNEPQPKPKRPSVTKDPSSPEADDDDEGLRVPSPVQWQSSQRQSPPRQPPPSQSPTSEKFSPLSPKPAPVQFRLPDRLESSSSSSSSSSSESEELEVEQTERETMHNKDGVAVRQLSVDAAVHKKPVGQPKLNPYVNEAHKKPVSQPKMNPYVNEAHKKPVGQPKMNPYVNPARRRLEIGHNAAQPLKSLEQTQLETAPLYHGSVQEPFRNLQDNHAAQQQDPFRNRTDNHAVQQQDPFRNPTDYLDGQRPNRDSPVRKATEEELFEVAFGRDEASNRKNDEVSSTNNHEESYQQTSAPQSQSQSHHSYSNIRSEQELFDVAFNDGRPSYPLTEVERQQSPAMQDPIVRESEQDLFNRVFMDGEGDESLRAAYDDRAHHDVRQGLSRRHLPSSNIPAYNLAARNFINRNNEGSDVHNRSNTELKLGEVIDLFDNGPTEEADFDRKPPPRRITEDHAQHSEWFSTVSNAEAKSQFPGRISRPWGERGRRKSRIRDPIASNPALAASVVPRKNQSRGETSRDDMSGPGSIVAKASAYIDGGDIRRYFRKPLVNGNANQQRDLIRSQRHDLVGHSDVMIVNPPPGARRHPAVPTILDRPEDDEIIEVFEDDLDDRKQLAAARTFATEQQPAPKKRRRATGKSSSTRSKGSRGRKRRGGGRGRGRGGRAGSGSKSNYSGRGRGRSARGGSNGSNEGAWGDGDGGGWNATPSFRREDPAFNGIGAEISF